MATKVMVRCGRCDGSGLHEAPVLTATLRSLSFEAWLTTAQLADKMRVKLTAMCNRLADLRKLGLVERRGAHRTYQWRRLP